MVQYTHSCIKPHLFLLGCIGTRLALTFGAYKLSTISSKSRNKQVGAVAMLIGISFILLWALNLRQTARESTGELTAKGNKVWWNYLRPIHGMMWILFGILMYRSYKHAWVVLLLDTLLGVERWIHYKFC